MNIKVINNKKIESNKIKLYRVNTGIYSEFKSTNVISNGKVVFRAEINDVQKHLCTLNEESTYAIDVATNEQFKILKRDKHNRIIEQNEPKLFDERYVISMEEITPMNKVKSLYLQRKYKKDKKKVNFR